MHIELLSLGDFVSDIWDGVTDAASAIVGTGIFDGLFQWFYELFYYIGIFFCKILRVLYQIFQIFSGIQKVTYNKSDDYLINIFFSNTTITTIYGGMALIGIIMLGVFTILAVVKKMADLGDKMQASLGEILRKAMTSFLFIVCMNFIMVVTLNVTNTLLQSVDYLFNNADAISEGTHITFDESEYATMARIFDTIGDYSVNPSYQSRYNINECFNEIRNDMELLESEKVFNYSYEYTISGQQIESWQSVLAQIARAHDLSYDQALDEYNIALSAAILNAMEYVTVNTENMTVLTSYQRPDSYTTISGADIATILWLTATTNAATNNAYNGTGASFDDPVRGAYLSGERDITNISQVESDFRLSFGSFNHLLVIIGGFMLCKEFLTMCVNAVARIFNLLLLYLMAPPFIATAPFDDGAKFKQWTTAFVIQAFNVYGSIIAMRLLILVTPIVFSSNLVLLGDGTYSMIAKVILILGCAYTARKAGSLISGIISENAGYQSLLAGDAYSTMSQGRLGQLAMGVERLGTESIGGAVGGLVGNTVSGIVKSPFRAHKTIKQNSERSAAKEQLQSDLKKGGDVGRMAGNRFLGMTQAQAKSEYNMGADEYKQTRNDIISKMDGEKGGASSGNGTGSGKENKSSAEKPEKVPPTRPRSNSAPTNLKEKYRMGGDKNE